MSFNISKAYTSNTNLRRVEKKEIKKIIKVEKNKLTIHNFLLIKNSLSLCKIGLRKIWIKLNIYEFRNFIIIDGSIYK